MKKTKRIIVLLVALMVASTLAVSLAACDKGGNYNPETRPFVMSLSQPDGVFNPFFSTAAADSSVIGMTQISMLSTDTKGHLVCGINEPTVALAYSIKEADDKKTTTYEFIIKNGMKWDATHDVTIKDVLFNLYVYLDPVYTGSATIYSTDIVGLKQYRTQREDLSDTGNAAFNATFTAEAQERIQNMIDFVGYYGPTLKDNEKTEPQGTREQALLDYAVTARTFYQELLSDWNNASASLESYKESEITETWQVFMISDGEMSELLKRNPDNTFFKDENGNTKLDKEAAQKFYESSILDYLVEKRLATIINDDATDFSYEITGEKSAVDNAIRDFCVNSVFTTYFKNFPTDILTREMDNFAFDKDKAEEEMNAVFKSIRYQATPTAPITGTDYNRFYMVVKAWQTASNILESFSAEQKSIYFKKLKDEGKRQFNYISGIDTRKAVVGEKFASQKTNANGESYTETITLAEDYDVLTIKINGVDPKAIYNFSFTVAPMWYYSGSMNGKNYIDSFSLDRTKGEFGLEQASSDFMTGVVGAKSKVGIPVGGGAYMAAPYSDDMSLAPDTFWYKTSISYERNPYFYTILGVPAEQGNAKIKYIRYSVVNANQIITGLKGGGIDLGEPNATKENKDEINSIKTLAKPVETSTNGYGYIGINPRFVPSVTVRRLIIKAMDRDKILDDYYTGGMAEIIERPMSTNNWAYPKGAQTYVADSNGTSESAGWSYAHEPNLGTGSNEYNKMSIYEKALYDEGYRKVGGVWEKDIEGFGKDRLDYKFTIAGESQDHPAYSMFLRAQTILNKMGFNVQVVTSGKALSDLSDGKLAVWAAAWSSAIDPDMYQVYHMDSQASSTKNWGYTQILNAPDSDAYEDEYKLVDSLSKLIDQGRATTKEGDRTEIYSRALDVIMEMAVEFPTYQRSDLTAYQANLLDEKTLPKEIGPFSGLLSRIWEINYR